MNGLGRFQELSQDWRWSQVLRQVPRLSTARERANNRIGKRMVIVLLARFFGLAEQLFLYSLLI